MREERYFLSGMFLLAKEWSQVDGDEEWMAELSFSSVGTAYYRVSQFLSRTTTPYFLELVENGRSVSRYESDWNRFLVDDFIVNGVPADFRLTSGRPLQAVEKFYENRDRAKLLLKIPHKDIELEFGFHFGQPGTHPAWAALRELGCTWRSEEERLTIGPYPEHCIMKVNPSLEELREIRERFISLALDYDGIFYDWLWP